MSKYIEILIPVALVALAILVAAQSAGVFQKVGTFFAAVAKMGVVQ